MIAARQIAFGKAAGKKEEPPAYWGLCFTAEEAGSTVAMSTSATNPPAVTLETSFDGDVWEPFTVGETVITLPSVGDKVYFRAGEGGNLRFAFVINPSRPIKYNFFVLTGRISASGSINSLLNGLEETVSLNTYAFAYLFRRCSSLTTAPELPATTLAANCYRFMFSGCTSLAQAPEFPATKLATNCYNYMFSGCTSLSQAPELPATKLATDCYRSMFSGCTSLAQAPELPATTLATNCYRSMFNGCINIDCIDCSFEAFGDGITDWLNNVSPIGTFVCPTALGTNETIQRGASYCPEGWTVINKD